MKSKKTNKYKLIRKCPLFLITCISIVGFMIVGTWLAFSGGYEIKLTFSHPICAAVLAGEFDTVEVLAKDDSDAEAMTEETSWSEEVTSEEESEEETTEEESTEEIIEIDRNLPDEEEFPYVRHDTVTVYEDWNDNPPRSRYYTNPGKRPLSSDYPYVQVDPTYYANSLFIGDSRMQGLHDYSGWEDGTFCYKTGLTIYRMMTDTVNIGGGLKSTVPEVLASRQFDNVYIMMGINELGSGLPTDFADKYYENIQIIKSYQPDARIIILGIMYVTAEYAEKNDVINNDNINARNAAIASFANGEDIFYLDMNPSVVDESGALNPEITFDGVHLIAKYYYLWADFMNEHGY